MTTFSAVLKDLSQVSPRPIEWLWPGYLPVGKLVVLDGDPGLGKSTLTLDLAARVSRGGPMPDGFMTEPAGVVLLSGEDGLEDTLVPRLRAAGADMSRIQALTRVTSGKQVELPVLPDHIEPLSEACGIVGARLVIIDPLTAYLGRGLNANHDQDVRQALLPVATLAEASGVTILLIRHLNQQSGGAALYRGGGSIAIAAAARIAYVVGRDPADEDKRILAATKCNIGPLPSSLRFEVGENQEFSTGQITWHGPCDLDADALLGSQGPRPSSKVAQAQDELRRLLAARPLRYREVETALPHVAKATLKRAATLLGIEKIKSSFDGGWIWQLPEGAHSLGKEPLGKDARQTTLESVNYCQSLPVAAEGEQSLCAQVRVSALGDGVP